MRDRISGDATRMKHAACDGSGGMRAAGRRAAALLLAAVLCAGFAVATDAIGGELVQGGGFETGDFTAAWVHGAGRRLQLNPSWADHAVVLDLPHSGNYSALLGFKYTQQRRDRYGFMYQNVTIPSNISSATLYFKFRQQGYDGLQYDPFSVEIRNTSNQTLATVVTFAFTEWNDQFKDSGWIDDDGVGSPGYDMTGYAGRTVRLYFRQDNSYDDLYETWVFVDDVSLIYRKFVDLAVDGNGDDLFGNPGTGAGGSSSRSGGAGDTIRYMLDIENEGLYADSYLLSAAAPAGWGIVISYGGTEYTFPWTTPTIPAGTAIEAEVRLSVPPGEPVGGYSSILDAVSTSFGNRYDSVELVTNVVPADHLTDLVIDANGFGVIDPDGGGGISYAEAPPDTEVTFLIDLINSGVLADSFSVWFRTAAPLTAVIEDGSIVHGGAFTTGAIDPDGTDTYTLRVTVPVAVAGGDYTSFVYAKSLTDTLRKDGVQAVTRVRAPSVDMVICGSGDGIIDPTGAGQGGSSTIAGVRGITVYFPLIIQNQGGVVDSFDLDWTPPGTGWAAAIDDGATQHAFPWTTPAFDPFSESSYILAVTIPGGASYDTYVSILEAVSRVNGNVRESVTAGVAVASGNEVDLIIDGSGNDTYGPLGTGLGGSSIKAASPGDTLYFAVYVESEGGQNLFDLQWTTPAGWEVVIGDSTATMRGVPGGTYTLEVRIPASCTGGTFDIIFDGMKTNKKFFVDSVRGRIFVTHPLIVDALIDGNGDDTFGMPGSGGGGFSEQGTIGGKTLNFTLELQNEGSAAERYAVSWNSFSGWSATCDGSGSPYITPPVAAGGAGLFTFRVTIPLSASEGDCDYIIDVASTADSSNVESVTARVHINPPPRADLLINGNGAFDTAPAGTGEGGRALVFGDPGTMVTAVLAVVNRGGFPDSFRITWREPDGWPAGSILLSDGISDYGSPFVTGLINPGASRQYTVKVFVPATAAARSRCIIDGEALSRDLEDSVLLEIAVTCIITGTVFDDADHDGACDPGETGWGGVTVILADPGGDVTTVTGASGVYSFEVPAGVIRHVIEITPSGMVSLSPDTAAVAAASAGDTVTVDFADVLGPSLVPTCTVNVPAGGFADLAHAITAGTAGQAVVGASLPAGWTEVFYRDVNGNGVLDGGDARLAASDLDLDPDVPGRDVVPIIVRVFVPPYVSAGTVGSALIRLEQTLAGTTIVAEASVTDRLLVLARASGMLRLVKDVDLDRAQPGDTLTYTITFTNPGVESVQEIEIIDPVPEAVDVVTDVFGPGNDIAWVRGGSTVYLTADPMDADEAMLEMPQRLLRIVLSRQSPFVLESGAEGVLIYRVRIR